jgi:hypothetical protein
MNCSAANFVGRKNYKPRIKNNRASNESARTQTAPPPRRWLDANKVMAGSAILGAVIAAVTMGVSNVEWHEEHRPRVILSRTPTLSELSCTTDGSIISGRQGPSDDFVKNTGNSEAEDVFDLAVDTSIVLGNRRTGNAWIDSPRPIDDRLCAARLKPSTAVSQLAPGQEVYSHSRQGTFE